MWENISSLVQVDSQTYQHLGYGVILVTCLIESLIVLGLLVPGGTVIVIAGYASYFGYLDIKLVFLIVVCTTIVGDTVSFYLGSSNLLSDTFIRKSKHNKYFVRCKKLFKNHGVRALFIAKYIPPLRPLVPFLAGVFRLKPVAFFCANTLSIVTWVSVFLGIGYFFATIVTVLLS